MQNPPKTQLPEPEFFTRAGDLTYACDLSGNLTFLSEEGERITGYSSAEACRMNITELLDPEIAEHACEQIVRGVRQCIGTVYEIDLIARDGRRVPLEVSTRVISRDGEPLEIQGIAAPSVIRSQNPMGTGLRCLDRNFFVGSSSKTSTITVCIA